MNKQFKNYFWHKSRDPKGVPLALETPSNPSLEQMRIFFKDDNTLTLCKRQKLILNPTVNDLTRLDKSLLLELLKVLELLRMFGYGLGRMVVGGFRFKFNAVNRLSIVTGLSGVICFARK